MPPKGMEVARVVRIEYTGYVKESGEVFDTTDEEVARKEGIYREGEKYGPKVVVIGAGHVIRGLEEEIEKMAPGEEREVDIPPEKAFGNRKKDLVKLISLREFKKAGIDPIPGRYVRIGGLMARVQSVSGGRVRVDFNHPLAGKTLRYKIKLIEELNNDLEISKGLLDLNFPPGVSFELKDEGEDLIVEIKESDASPEELSIGKEAGARDILEYTSFKRVIFQEVFPKQ
ncbi:peptidylprolyl isomerase [Candidatus Bathyarchaeota archaeon ex4484_205]|nr:MAG: peptidylprolyl isomerase [Candidatus Bathyarchaeota archaeon ex4484_205]RLF97226.1 MAG: peptidylprolyl isomerase [Thermococci archaeon]HDI10337.1 peptidylprolyl isomerase [Euryarchaeota archaeon]